jgi:hypothetical protein
MDEGVIAAAKTRREVMRLSDVPKSTDRGWRWERHIYGSAEEIVFGLTGEDSVTSVFIAHGTASATCHGWAEALDLWRDAGSPVDVRVEDVRRAPIVTSSLEQPSRLGCEDDDGRAVLADRVDPDSQCGCGKG